MRPNNIKDELQNILQGKNRNSSKNAIQAVASYLRRSQKTSSLAQNDKYFKREETKRLIVYVEENNLAVTRQS